MLFCTVVVELASYLRVILLCHYVVHMNAYSSRDWLVVAAGVISHRWYAGIIWWQPRHRLNAYCACVPNLKGNRRSIRGWKGLIMSPTLLYDSSTSADWPFVFQGAHFCYIFDNYFSSSADLLNYNQRF